MDKEPKCEAVDHSPALKEMAEILLAHPLLTNAVKVEYKITIQSSCGCIAIYETTFQAQQINTGSNQLN